MGVLRDFKAQVLRLLWIKLWIKQGRWASYQILFTYSCCHDADITNSITRNVFPSFKSKMIYLS
ncbi:hypothetical protein IEQ34_003080 [Dendrobium chrysotoxum]|uniref:Uncharacterized protein n=1 Tax=Dendrobium chrysotoxum TaxID=161865 RepID=A0AAV7HJN6_DENCH|nr:hypothetical protein IEQ34_003080 [Dendrobium chrysotoxum]